MRARRLLPLLTASVLALPCVVLAADDAPVATGRTEAPLPQAAPAAPLSTDEAIEDFLSDKETQAGPGKRNPHGTVGVAIGAGGYHQVDASVIIPVGENGTIAAAVVIAEGGPGPGRQHSGSQGPAR
jgi:hypothetical protein